MRLKKLSERTFQENIVPPTARLAGWAALAHELSIPAPVRHPCCVSEKHIRGSRREEHPWTIFDRRYWPGEDFADHLAFALRHEPFDPLVLKRIFDVVKPSLVTQFIRLAPTGVVNRRAWFFYEAFTGRKLPVPDAAAVAAVDALDPSMYFTGTSQLSPRHRVRDNLPGTSKFCPIIRRTPALEALVASGLEAKAAKIIGDTRKQLIARAASFMLLADSRASFEIEGERPPRGRLERWGRAVLQAGRNPLTLDEIRRLHGVLIEDTRFVQAGIRTEGVFLGERDHDGDPLPEFVGAKPTDLTDLLEGMLGANNRMREAKIDPVLQAAAMAFGFVYVHPFEDGNGRLHRCLIHHVLAERKFTPPGLVFPVSSVMLDRIDEYRDTLRGHSGPLMRYIEWQATPKRNVEVLNETADLYRYYDCTDEAEFLYECVQRTVERDLPREIDYLERHDTAMKRIMETVEMPDQLAENLIRYVRQNGGKLGKKRRENEFRKLTGKEVAALEFIVSDEFDDLPA